MGNYVFEKGKVNNCLKTTEFLKQNYKFGVKAVKVLENLLRHTKN